MQRSIFSYYCIIIISQTIYSSVTSIRVVDHIEIDYNFVFSPTANDETM